MASRTSSDTIVIFLANNKKTEIALRNSQNINRFVKGAGISAPSIRLSFTTLPKSLKKGFVFGTDDSCDIRLSDEEAIGELFSINVSPLKKRNPVEIGGTYVGLVLRCQGLFKEIGHGSIVHCAGYSFIAKIPNRGKYQKQYYNNLADYFDFIQHPERALYAAPVRVEASIGPFLKLKHISSWGYGELSVFTHQITGKAFSVRRFKDSKEKAKVSRKLSMLKSISHENIVKYHDDIYNQGSLYLLMDHLPFKSLRQYKSLSPSVVADILSQCLNALAYLHDQKIMHRTVTPDNIVLRSKFPLQIKLVGLEFSRKTIAYTAPEVWDRGSPSSPTDIWSLGLIVLELLKVLPKRELNKLHQFIDKKAFADYLDAIQRTRKKAPFPFVELLEGMLDVNPKHRWSVKRCLHQIPKLQRDCDVLHKDC